MAVVVVAPFAPRGPAYAAHSTTERAIVGTGLLSFTVQANLSYTPGMRVRVSATASESWMEGVVKTYAGTLLTIEIQLSDGGGGPYKDWNINLAGEPGIVPTYAGTATNAKLLESRATNAVTFKLVTLAGSDPTDVNIIPALFLNGTLRLIVDGSVSLTIPATCKLGTADQTPFRLWLLLIDDNGVLKLGAIQTREIQNNAIQAMPPNGIIPASMFVSGISNSSGKVYTSAPSILVDRPYIIIGFADYDTGLTTAGDWNVAPNRIVMFGPGVKLPGDELQIVGYQTGTYGGYGDIQIPLDNTVPLITEGAQTLTQAITPRCAQSVLEVEAQMIVSFETAGRILTGALFDSRGSNAIVTTFTNQQRTHLYLWARTFAWTAGVAFSFSTRIGLSGAGASGFNGDNSGAIFGGSCDSYIQVIERQT